jgi:hypothetical protein
MKRRFEFIIPLIMILLFLFSLACKQSGEILTPAEATQRYESTQVAQSNADDLVGEFEGAIYSTGSTVELGGEGFLVGLYEEAGVGVPFSYASRGDQVPIIGSLEFEGEVWYKVETSAGNGWVPETTILPGE